MLHHLVAWLVGATAHWGYPGIVALMALESSFLPFPSEVVIPPAAYLAAGGQMSLSLVVLCGVLGSLLGAVFNYWLAMRFGRPFLERHGRLMLIQPQSLARAERYFARHGRVSTFTGRLLPVIRQYISLPAGLARMNFAAFCLATTLGSGAWVLILAGLGYWFGGSERLVAQQLHWISLVLAVACGGLILVCLWRRRRVPTPDGRGAAHRPPRC